MGEVLNELPVNGQPTATLAFGLLVTFDEGFGFALGFGFVADAALAPAGSPSIAPCLKTDPREDLSKAMVSLAEISLIRGA